MARNASWDVEVKPNLPYLTANITNLKRILISLISKDIISGDESETISKEKTKLNRNFKLLEIIKAKDWKRIKVDFIQILQNTHNEHCVGIIEKVSKPAPTTGQHTYSNLIEIKFPNTLGFNHSTKRVLNILLLGKTGVGKSNFINSFANFVLFETVEDIRGIHCIRAPIPCSFDDGDDEGNPRNFKMGEESNEGRNETMNSMSSGSQGCKTYPFYFKGLQINLIDTPSIVDTLGVEKDKKNVEDILEFIRVFKSFDGICILMKSDEKKLDPALRHCIFEILNQLDKSVAQKIFYGFTNASSTFYHPGSTTNAIQELISEVNLKKPDLKLNFSKENYFCFGSELFRFLILKDFVNYDDDQRNMVSLSWRKSRQECVRMIEFIARLPQHDVQNTISINKARKLIESLLKPLVDISENITENQEQCKKI